jgi:hypothetical protein
MIFPTAKKRWLVVLSVPLALSACTSMPTVVRSTDAEVAVRYDGIVNGIDDAKQMAEKTCAVRGKTARLRRVSDQGLGRSALRLFRLHFDDRVELALEQAWSYREPSFRARSITLSATARPSAAPATMSLR